MASRAKFDRKAYFRAYNIKYRARRNELQNIRRAKNPNRFRNAWLKQAYGLSWLAFEMMLIQQNGRCAICVEPFNEQHTAAVDHDHATGQVRGLLCSKCNIWLGRYERPGIRESAEAYLAANVVPLRMVG